MSDWSAGYVTSIEYVTACYPEQGPNHLDLMALLHAVEPPMPHGRVSYCELGAGQGMTATMIAATNPDIDVHAIDFMPAQVARARDFAASLGIDNISFHEASFDDLAAGRGPSLPNFDYVTMHGVYSWISRENQEAIIRLLATKLNPGGLVYTSYNAMPGWGGGFAIQRLLSEVAGLSAGPPVQRMAEGFQMMKRLFDAGAVHLAGNELAKQLFEEDHNPSYVAHEYLNRYWRPLFFADVARDFAGAKLEYVGAARAIDMFDKFFVTPTQAEIIGAVADPVVAETLRDYCRVRTFRADIHVKGLRRLSPREQEAGLASVPLALSGDTAEFPYRFGAPEGLVTLPEEIFKPIIEALAEQGPMTLGELLRQPGWPGQPPKSMAEAVGVLLATRRVAAAAPITDAAMVARCRRINSRAAQRIPELATRFGVPVAVPAVRNAGYMAPVDLIAVALLNNSPNLDDAGLVHALADLADPGELETPGGGAAENPTARLAAMVADRRRIWRHLGLID